MFTFALDAGDQGAVQAERGVQQLAQARHAGEARELQEDFMDVLADHFIGGEEPVIGVEPCGLGVIIAGAQMAVAPQSTLFPPHHHDELGVGLEAEYAVHHVRPRLLQLGRDVDVGFLIESGAQFDDHSHVLARLCGFGQCADDG